MVRRFVVVVLLVAASGLTVVAVSTPAGATGFTSSNITSPQDGRHFFITDANPEKTVLVTGTISPATPGATVDIRCYESPGYWQTESALQSVPLNGAGTSFSVHMHTGTPYATCKLRAVPHGWPATSSVTAFQGPRLTTEWTITKRIDSGPNTGKMYDMYAEFVGAHAMNDFSSAFVGGLWDSRMQYPNGSSSNYFWYGNAFLGTDPAKNRSAVRVDGRNAYGPDAAETIFPDNPGFAPLTFSATRNATTGVVTIHESDPMVVCPDKAYPPTALSCPRFKRIGVTLRRTITIVDGGLQVRIVDAWRSTDHQSHSVSAIYGQRIDGNDRSSGTALAVPVGIKLPWRSNVFTRFTTDTVYPGPAHAPASIFALDNKQVADGNKYFARGAVTMDMAPMQLHRTENGRIYVQMPRFRVPADGAHRIRQYYVMGILQSDVNSKAAANVKRLK